MGKNKTKHQKSPSFLSSIDNNLKDSHKKIMSEITEYQIILEASDKKARKKAKKKSNKRRGITYEMLQRDAREKIIKDMEGDNFFDRLSSILSDIGPLIILISRLVAGLILSILSITSVKVNINPDTLIKMNTLFEKAMTISFK